VGAKIAPHNRVEFKRMEEALEAGYRPCKVAGRETVSGRRRT